MPSHKCLRALAACSILLSLASLLASCGGGSQAPGSPAPAARPEALRSAQPGELAAYFKSRIVKRNAENLGGLAVSPTGAGGLIPASESASDSAFAGTNLQEAGIDEDDLIKSDGRFVYALHPADSYGGGNPSGRLEARKIHPDGSLGASAGVELAPQTWAMGMYLTDTAERVVVLGQKFQGHPQLSLDIYDVPDSAPPVHTRQVLIDGTPVSTRRIGNVLYVASTWSPNLGNYWPALGATPAQAEAAVAGLTSSALLPTIRIGSGPAQPLVAEGDCQLQPANASLSLQLTTITAIDLSTSSLERRSRCFVGDGHALYMSPSAAYVATSRNYWVASGMLWAGMPERATTDIHKFSLQGMQIDYRGSAEVTGHLGWDPEKTPYRMSEHQGDLRVLTFTGSTGWGPRIPVATTTAQQAPSAPPSPATLTVLREDPVAGRLAQVATLPNGQRPAALGHAGEQVYAVQFAGPLAYVVTFRRTDPLYVLDLSDPADPKIAGELEMPGFSDYLFPLANGKLLGVGKDATPDGLVQGLKVTLFDVSTPAQPLLLSSRSLGERGSASALDHSRHGINIFQQGPLARIALPVSLASTSAQGEGSARRGLARFLVDTVSGTLQERPMIAAPPITPTSDDSEEFLRGYLGYERSIQAANATYYLSGKRVSYTPEP